MVRLVAIDVLMAQIVSQRPRPKLRSEEVAKSSAHYRDITGQADGACRAAYHLELSSLLVSCFIAAHVFPGPQLKNKRLSA